MVDKGNDENFRGFKSGQKSFSICVCQVNPGLIRSGILFLDATYATCSVGLRVTL